MSIPVSRRLLLALAASVVVHFLMVYGAEFPLPDWTQSEPPIQVSLVVVPPPAVSAPETAPPARKAAPPPANPAGPPARPREPEPEQAPAPSAPEPLPVAMQEAPPATVPPPSESEPVPVAVEDMVEVPPSPKRVEIDFQLFRGKPGSGSVGRVKQVFQLEQDNRYMLHSVAEASGLVSLFVAGRFEERSEGMVTARGLVPVSFRQQRGSPDKVQVASFDWASHTVALEAGTRLNVVDVPDGAQDMLSFMYQFMFVPPLDEMRITVANGRKLRTYAYNFEGEEQVETRLGSLRAWHIAKAAAEGEEKTDLWLAMDYRFLPVKIRQTDKDGTVTEQVVTRLLME